VFTGAGGVRDAHPLFQAGGSGATPTAALQLWFGGLSLATAMALNRLWHSRLPRIDARVAGWECYVAEFGGLYYAAAIWGLPVARLLPQDGSCLELRRLAIAPDAPKNTASRMLGWMVRDVRRRFPAVNRLVSYQDCEVHAGTIYRASGWTAVVAPGGGCWHHAGRPRPSQRLPNKVRWEKVIR
jgi:hypothetical protein